MGGPGERQTRRTGLCPAFLLCSSLHYLRASLCCWRFPHWALQLITGEHRHSVFSALLFPSLGGYYVSDTVGKRPSRTRWGLLPCFLAYLLTCLRPPGAAHCVLHHLCPKHTQRSRSRSCGVVRPSQLPSAPELEDSCTETAAETAVVHTVASSSCSEDLSVPFSLPFPFIDPCIHPTVGRSHAYTVPSPYLVSFHPYPIINVLFMGSRMAQFLNLSRLIPLTLPHFPPRASAAYSRIYIDAHCRTTLEHPSYAYSSLLPLCT